MANYINLGLGKLLNSSAVLSTGNALLKDKMNITMGEALKITVFSMLLVFLILLIISYMIDLMKYVLDKKSNKKETEKAEVSIEQVIDAVEEIEEDDDTELVAVIMAAIEAYTGTSSKGLVVKNIKKVSTNDSLWAVAGKNDLLK